MSWLRVRLPHVNSSIVNSGYAAKGLEMIQITDESIVHCRGNLAAGRVAESNWSDSRDETPEMISVVGTSLLQKTPEPLSGSCYAARRYQLDLR